MQNELTIDQSRPVRAGEELDEVELRSYLVKQMPEIGGRTISLRLFKSDLPGARW